MLRQAWQAWKRTAHRIGTFQARVLLTVLYGTVVFPFGLAARLVSDVLRVKHRPDQWLDHVEEAHDLEWARRQ